VAGCASITAFQLELQWDHLEQLDQLIARLNQKVTQLYQPYEQPLALVDEVPGMDRRMAETVMAGSGYGHAPISERQPSVLVGGGLLGQPGKRGETAQRPDPQGPNGRGQVLSRGGDFGDINNNRACRVNAYVKREALYGLRVGGSIYRDLLNPLGGAVGRGWIESAHVVWEKETPEVLAEFGNIRHEPLNGGVTSNSQAYYIQAAYRLLWFENTGSRITGFEYLQVPVSDVFFGNVMPPLPRGCVTTSPPLRRSSWSTGGTSAGIPLDPWHLHADQLHVLGGYGRTMRG
jgi:hypothetical protein